MFLWKAVQIGRLYKENHLKWNHVKKVLKRAWFIRQGAFLVSSCAFQDLKSFILKARTQSALSSTFRNWLFLCHCKSRDRWTLAVLYHWKHTDATKRCLLNGTTTVKQMGAEESFTANLGAVRERCCWCRNCASVQGQSSHVHQSSSSGITVISTVYSWYIHREMKQRSSRTMVLQKTTHSPHGTTQN